MSQNRGDGVTVSAVLSTLSPGGVGKSLVEAGVSRAKVADDWQMLGTHYHSAELHGVAKGLPHGYFADLLGRAAAAGEQLGISFAALCDAEVWRDTPLNPTSATRRAIAGRAMAEASGLWAISAGHAMTNVVARVIRIHKDAEVLDKKLSWVGPPTPFDTSRLANLSLNPVAVNALVDAAAATKEPALVAVVTPLSGLVVSAAWVALTARRDAGYHRLRPQSVNGGVPSANPWEPDDTAGSLTMSVAAFSMYEPPDLEAVVREAYEGHEELSAAMRLVHDRLPAALRAAGVPIFRAD